MFKSIPNYARLYYLAFGVLILDQITKLWVMHSIPYSTYIYPNTIPIINNFFYLAHVRNTGAAWGQLSGQTYWLATLALIALLLIYIFRNQLELHRHSVQWAFGLLIGGVIGNFIDRLAYGFVVDFLDVHIFSYRWPAFNIADCGITIGVIIYIFLSFKKDLAKKA